MYATLLTLSLTYFSVTNTAYKYSNTWFPVSPTPTVFNILTQQKQQAQKYQIIYACKEKIIYKACIYNSKKTQRYCN